jgi:Ulp1 family protease
MIYKNYILNMSNSDNPGTHWISLIIDNSKNDICYFDSFGVLPLREVYELFLKDVITFSKIQIQDINSTNCEWYCLAFIYYMNNNNNKNKYDDFLKMFDRKDFKKNDKILADYLMTIFK